jgi:hypothetical protein
VTGQFLEVVTEICTRRGMPLQHLEVHTARTGNQEVELVCVVPTDAILAQALGQLQGLSEVQAVQADLEGLHPGTRKRDHMWDVPVTVEPPARQWFCGTCVVASISSVSAERMRRIPRSGCRSHEFTPG